MNTALAFCEDSSATLVTCPSQSGWRDDVALELWIDVGRRPATIRLAGTLDGTTAVNLVAVVAELIAEGIREFDLHTEALSVPGADGVGTLRELGLLVQRSGGCLTRDGSVVASPWAVPAGPGEIRTTGL